MKKVMTTALILITIAGKSQTVPDRANPRKAVIVNTWPVDDSVNVYEFVVRLAHQVQELQDRIKVLEARPYLAIIPMHDTSKRGVWMLQAKGGYSILLKQFKYP